MLQGDRILVSNYWIAPIYVALGNNDKAFENLELAYIEKDSDFVFLKFEPPFDALHSDPRFDALLKKIGLE